MKKKRSSKMQIEELRVQSFVTELKPEVALTAKGGEDDTFNGVCQATSPIIVASITNSGNSKWPCRFACNSGGGGSSGGGSGGGPAPSDTNPYSC